MHVSLFVNGYACKHMFVCSLFVCLFVCLYECVHKNIHLQQPDLKAMPMAAARKPTWQKIRHGLAHPSSFPSNKSISSICAQHTHTHTHAPMHTHKHMHARTHTYAHIWIFFQGHIYCNGLWDTRSNTHMHTHMAVRAHTHTHAHSLFLTHTHLHIHTHHTQRCTDTRTCSHKRTHSLTVKHTY